MSHPSESGSSCCFICLSDEGELLQPCKCPRHAHARCGIAFITDD